MRKKRLNDFCKSRYKINRFHPLYYLYKRLKWQYKNELKRAKINYSCTNYIIDEMLRCPWYLSDNYISTRIEKKKMFDFDLEGGREDLYFNYWPKEDEQEPEYSDSFSESVNASRQNAQIRPEKIKDTGL